MRGVGFTPMKTTSTTWLRLVLCLMVAVITASRVVQPIASAVMRRNVRIDFPQATIDGQPVNIMLDTGSETAMLSEVGAQKLGLKFGPPVDGVTTPPKTVREILAEPAKFVWGSVTFASTFPVMTLVSVDGFVGWDEVRNNILVFNADHRTVSSADKLPDETAAWLKLKTHPGGQLVLETALADGKTGTILIDTGSPFGVSLPTKDWEAWKAAHPQAKVTIRHFTGISAGSGTFEEAWADEIKLGNLTLKDVPVAQATAFDMAIHDNFVASLGLYAVSRMNLVVDGKNNLAYVQPKTTPGLPYPGVTRPGFTFDPAAMETANQDWTVTGNLVLNTDHLRATPFDYRGKAEFAKGDVDAALADFNQALATFPNFTVAYIDRGMLKAGKKDYDGAIADYNLALKVNPYLVAAYIDRGNSLGKKGDQDGAIADYTHALELDPRHVTAFFDRGNAHSAQKDYDHAIADYNRTLLLDPKNINALNNRGLAKEAQKDWDGALADYEQILKLDPKNVKATARIALVKQRQVNLAPASAK